MTGRHAGRSSGLSRSTRQPRARPRPTRTWLLRTAALVVLVLVGLGGWLIWSGLQARDELSAARVATQQLRHALLAGDAAAAKVALAEVTAHANRAHSLTGGPVWAAAAWVPYLGRTPEAVTRAATAVDGIARGVLPGLADVAKGMNPSTLRQGDRVDIAGLEAVAPAVTAASGHLRVSERQLADIQLDGVVGPVAIGVRGLRDEVTTLGDQLDAAATATRLLPAMLGADMPRRYLVVFQNNAEARGTGGLVGAFAVVQATKGRISVVRLGSDSELKSATAPVVDLGPAYRALFGTDPALWANTNLSAHFPSAAVQQLGLWQRQFGERLDGVIAMDPVVLGYLLGPAGSPGPATLPGGERITGAKVADLTMREVYARYAAPSQVLQRKAYLQLVARAALDHLIAGGGNAHLELDALGRAAGERRLLVYSAHPEEETLLGGTALGGVVDARPGPYAAVALDNAAGSKIDYYLERQLTYSLGQCSVGGSPLRPSTITVTLRDGAPSTGLPEYVAYRLDRGPASTPQGRGGDGSTRETVLVYAAMGAQLTGATLDGATVSVTPGKDGAAPGRPVFVLSVELAAGQTRTVVLDLTEPSTDLPARSWVQPLVQPATSTVQAGTCR